MSGRACLVFECNIEARGETESIISACCCQVAMETIF